MTDAKTTSVSDRISSNLFDLEERLRKRLGSTPGDVVLLICNCKEGGTAVISAALCEGGKTHVIGLICPACEREISVIDGRIYAEQWHSHPTLSKRTDP